MTIAKAALVIGSFSASRLLAASTQTWNPSNAGGGNGNWSTSAAAWDTGGTDDWTDGNNGTFGGTAGTATITDGSGTISLQTGTFATTGYTITGEQINLVGTTPGFAGTSSSISTTINSTIAGSAGAQFLTGTFILGGTNTYTNGTNLDATTVEIGNASGLAAGNISVISASASTIEATAALTLANTISTGSTTATLILKNGIATSSNVFNVSGPIGGTGSVSISSNSSPMELSNDGNSFSGLIGMGYGTFDFTSVANASSPSSLGEGGNITIGNSGSHATLNFVGTSTSPALAQTTRLLNWSGTTGALTINASGVEPLQFLNTSALRSGSGINTLTLTGGNTGANTLAESIADSGGATSLSNTGTGTWILTGADTYSGATSISAGGTLAIGNGTNGYIGSTAVTNAGTLIFNEAPGSTTSSNMSNSGTLIFAQTAGVANTFGGTVSNSGTLLLAETAGGTTTLGGTISGSGTFSQTGAGTAIFSGNNTYTSTTSVTAGTLSVSGNETAANGSWAIGTNSTFANANTSAVNFLSGSVISVASGKTVQIGINGSNGAYAQSLNVAGTVSNAGALAVDRLGALNINSGGSWTQSGSMAVNSFSGYGGTLTINSGGAFVYNNSTTSLIAINPSTNNLANSYLYVSGGSFNTNQGFTNTVTGSTASANLILSGGGTLQLGASIPSLATAAGTSPFYFQLGSGGGIIDTQSYSTTMSLPISNVTGQTGSLTQVGSGVLTLTASNTYSGATTITSGTLAVDASSGTGVPGASIASTPSITIGATGTLHLLSSTSTSPLTMLSSTVNISVVTGAQIDLDLNGQSQTVNYFIINNNGEAPGYYGSAAGLAAYGVTTPDSSADNYFTYGSLGVLDVTSIPEPASLSIVAIAGLGLLGRRRKTLRPGTAAFESSPVFVR